MEYDDGMRVIVNNKVVIDHLDGPPSKIWKEIQVLGCTSITVEYRQLTGGSYIKFGWTNP
jgi:hypothetical protein